MWSSLRTSSLITGSDSRSIKTSASERVSGRQYRRPIAVARAPSGSDRRAKSSKRALALRLERLRAGSRLLIDGRGSRPARFRRRPSSPDARKTRAEPPPVERSSPRRSRDQTVNARSPPDSSLLGGVDPGRNPRTTRGSPPGRSCTPSLFGRSRTLNRKSSRRMSNSRRSGSWLRNGPLGKYS